MELTYRLKKIKKRLFEVEFNDPGVWYFKDVNILDNDEKLKQEPLVIRKAKAQEYICLHLPAIIKSDEIIVGNPNQNGVNWGSVIPIYYTKEEGEQAARYELNEASVWGHHPPAWDKIIKKGIVGIKEEINKKIVEQFRSVKVNQEVLNEYRAMIISLDGLVAFSKKHAQSALKEAIKCKDPIRSRELFEIYEVCNHIPENPARNLHEATQAYWFTYCILNSSGEYIPLGRADQILYPYFKKDLSEGKITKERAIDIIGSFLAKCNERVVLDLKKAENHCNFGLFSQGYVPDLSKAKVFTGGYEQKFLTWQEDEDINSEANFNYGQSGNDWLMNCIVGGQNADGSDATNELSYLIIDIMHKMKLIMPTLAVRVHRKTPDFLYNKVAEVLRYGQGEPIIYNDETIIPGFIDMGIPLEEARDYSNDGCWETLIPGKSHSSYAHVMNLRCLEWVLFRGISQHNRIQEGLDMGDPTQFKEWQKFYKAYKKQMYARIDFQCKRRLENFGLTYMIAPDPLMSSIMLDCVEKGKDLSQDGARYIFHLILITGLANTVDSLAVIKKLIYDEKSVAMEELIQALKSNWKGHGRLRAKILNKVPKFGSDDDYVDSIAIQLLKDFEDRVGEWNRKQNIIRFPVGIGTFENYALLGREIGASPDGRYFGDPLATNYSPSPGVDINGPTAVFRSVTKPELLKYYCGCPLDLSVNSNEFTGEAGIERMKGLIKTFGDLGGQILTINSMNVEDLKDAKVHPEKHKSLRIRLGGLSAYFTTLAPIQQDNIIKRFERS